MLIDSFVNAVFLYDDKMLINFNYKEGARTVTFDDVLTARLPVRIWIALVHHIAVSVTARGDVFLSPDNK